METLTMNLQQDFVAMVQKHQAGIWRYLRSLGADHATADDLTQETFLAVYQKPFERKDGASCWAYLRTVARNRFIDTLRKRKAGAGQLDIDAVDATWKTLAANDDGSRAKEALKQCMQRLPDHARLALDLQFRDRASREAIAQTLNMQEEGVKTLMRRIRMKLRQCIERRLGIGG